MKKISVYRTSSTDPSYNLALEQFLFEKKAPGEILVILWKNDRAVIVGRYQNVSEEVNLKFAKLHDIHIVRRVSGGGAVYHDLGNLNYSFIVDLKSQDLNYCKDVLRGALAQLGITYEPQGRNDIFIDGHKVSGTAQHIEADKVVYHGTLLINSDLGIMRKVLTRNNKVADTRSTKSRPAKVGNLCDLIPEDICVDIVERAIQEEFGVKDADRVTESDEARINEIIEERYGNEEWNYGFPMEYNQTYFRRFPSGGVRLSSRISDGVIQSMEISGDFIAKKDIGEMEKLFIGLRVDEDIKAILHHRKAGDYIEGISCKDWEELYKGMSMRSIG